MTTYTLPTLPPLGEYPTAPPPEGQTLEKLQADWRELARLYVSAADVEVRQAAQASLSEWLESIPALAEQILGRWAEHDAAADRNTTALSSIADAVSGLEFPAGSTTTGLPVDLVTALLVAIVGALRPGP